VFEGENIVLRWDKGDVASVVKYANNRKIWRNLQDMFPHPYTTEDAEACIELTLTGEAHQYHFVIDREGECIGAAGLIPKSDVHRKTVEIGYWKRTGSNLNGGIGTPCTKTVNSLINWCTERCVLDCRKWSWSCEFVGSEADRVVAIMVYSRA